MNRKIAAIVGLITGMSILAFIIVLRQLNVPANSSLVFIQFLLATIGIFISCALLFKYYAGIRFIEALNHSFRTLSSIIFTVVMGNVILFIVFKDSSTSWKELNLLIMKTIFSYGLSGVLSSFFCSYIFYTFTKNK